MNRFEHFFLQWDRGHWIYFGAALGLSMAVWPLWGKVLDGLVLAVCLFGACRVDSVEARLVARAEQLLDKHFDDAEELEMREAGL